MSRVVHIPSSVMVGVLSFMSFKLIEVDSRTTDNYPNKKRPQKIVISCLEWQRLAFYKGSKKELIVL